MPRRGKKRGRNKRRAPTTTLTTVKDVVTKAMKSKKIMQLWQDTVLHEELVDLKRRLEKAHSERDSLRKRVAEREDQQEAVFDSLKERVIVAQAEIQVEPKRDSLQKRFKLTLSQTPLNFLLYKYSTRW